VLFFLAITTINDMLNLMYLSCMFLNICPNIINRMHNLFINQRTFLDICLKDVNKVFNHWDSRHICFNTHFKLLLSQMFFKDSHKGLISLSTLCHLHTPHYHRAFIIVYHFLLKYITWVIRMRRETMITTIPTIVMIMMITMVVLMFLKNHKQLHVIILEQEEEEIVEQKDNNHQ